MRTLLSVSQTGKPVKFLYTSEGLNAVNSVTTTIDKLDIATFDNRAARRDSTAEEGLYDNQSAAQRWFQ